MAEITVSSKDEEKPTIIADMSEAGIHFFTDQGFFQRVSEIRSHFSEYMTSAEIDAIGLTPKRTVMMKMAMRKLEFVWFQLAYGKAKENPKLTKAIAAARRIILRVEGSLESEASDAEVIPICRERLSMLDPLILFTFDSQNTTINKAFTVVSSKNENFHNQPQERGSSSTELSRIAREQREKRLQAAQS